MATATLTWADFLCIALVMVISSGVGLFHGYLDRKETSSEHFMTGSGRMPLIPTAISMVASLVTGMTMLSIPAEVYQYGVVIAWSAIGYALATALVAMFMLPVMMKCKSISLYSYVEDRFESKFLRFYCCVIFQFSSIFFTAVVLYGPAMALETITGYSLAIWIFLLGIVCIFYTSIGGLKAVVWTDAIQAAIMYTGLIAVLVQGTIVVGGVSEVFRLSDQGYRFSNAFNFDLDPFQYMTVWAALYGNMIYGVNSFGISQLAYQRYRGMPSLRHARKMTMLTIPGMALMTMITSYIGLIMYAYYIYCDPIKSGTLKFKDQLVIWYAFDLLADMKGMPGLFLASLFCATLSTVSTNINSMSAILLEDFVRQYNSNLGQSVEMKICKWSGVAFGFVTMAVAFAAKPLGGIMNAALSVTGLLGGPTTGVIVAGMFFRVINKPGGIAGSIAGTLAGLLVFVGNLVDELVYPSLPAVASGCNMTRAEAMVNFTLPDYDGPFKFTGIDRFFGMSFVLSSAYTFTVALLVSLVVSYVTGGSRVCDNRPDLMFSWKMLRWRQEDEKICDENERFQSLKLRQSNQYGTL